MRASGIIFGAVLLATGAAWGMAPKDVYKQAGPAVVLILGSDDGRAGSGGTGSIVTREGKVVTNAHVVLNESGKPFKILYVFLKPPKLTGDNKKDLSNRYTARVLAYSPAEQLDLALLQIENAPKDLPTINFADPDRVDVGDQVIAIGHPEQGGLWTLTTGTISTVIANFGRVEGKDVFQTEASVNRGNSGGPLLDLDGNMVGINTMIAREGAGGVAITGVNFSLKSSVAVKWVAGQGMGLAYAPKNEPQMVVAMAPEAQKPAAVRSETPKATEPVVATSVASAPASAPVKVDAAPPDTIVVAEAPPAKVETLRQEGTEIGRGTESEKLVSGKPLDPKTATPKYLTKKRPFSLDDLRRQQMKELEDMMDDARGKIQGKSKDKSKFDDMGL